jgi:hypothetical protein
MTAAVARSSIEKYKLTIPCRNACRAALALRHHADASSIFTLTQYDGARGDAHLTILFYEAGSA